MVVMNMWLAKCVKTANKSIKNVSWVLTMCSALCDTLNILKFILNWLPHGLKCHFEKYKFNRKKHPNKKRKKKMDSSLLQLIPFPTLLNQLNLFSRAAWTLPVGSWSDHCSAGGKRIRSSLRLQIEAEMMFIHVACLHGVNEAGSHSQGPPV